MPFDSLNQSPITARLHKFTQLPQSSDGDNEDSGPVIHVVTDPEQSTAQDLDAQGDIRTVANAHLVYKRKDSNNQYSELWVYKRDSNEKNSSAPFDAILAGTDIERGQTSSADGEQSVKMWEVGPVSNTVCFVEITGLSN